MNNPTAKAPPLPKCEKCGRTRDLHGGFCFECACLSAMNDGAGSFDANRVHAAWLKMPTHEETRDAPPQSDPEHFDS